MKWDGHKLTIDNVDFDRIRAAPDFKAFIRIGRLLNALYFSIEALQTRGDRSTARHRRASMRYVFIAGGYLAESILLLKNLQATLGAEPFFQQANDILAETERESRRWMIVNRFRNQGGFHLDHEDRITERTLSTLDLPEYELYSADGQTLDDLYIDFNDAIDFTFILDRLKGDQSEDETAKELLNTIIDLLREVSATGRFIIEGLTARLEIQANDAS